MQRFGSDPSAFFNAAYQWRTPWDIGGAQPALVALFEKYPPGGPVLDVGCGTGDLAIHLAKAGLEVLGIDFSEAAIALARKRVAALPAGAVPAPEFVVADALRLTQLRRQFATVVDSGFLHGLDRGDDDRFVEALASVLNADGRYYILAFAAKRRWFSSPPGLSEDALRRHFAPERGWHIHDIGPAKFQMVGGSKPAIRACIERLPVRREQE